MGSRAEGAGMAKQFLALSEAGRIAGVSIWTVRGWFDRGQVTGQRIRGMRVVEEMSLRRMVAERAAEQASKDAQREARP